MKMLKNPLMLLALALGGVLVFRDKIESNSNMAKIFKPLFDFIDKLIPKNTNSGASNDAPAGTAGNADETGNLNEDSLSAG